MGFFLRLTAVPRSTLRLRHARPSNVYPPSLLRAVQGREDGDRDRGCYRSRPVSGVILLEIPRPPCFPNSGKVSHVCAHKALPSLPPPRCVTASGAFLRGPPVTPARFPPASKRGSDEIALIKYYITVYEIRRRGFRY